MTNFRLRAPVWTVAAATWLVGCGGGDPVDLVTVRTLGLAYLEENQLPEAETEFLRLVDLAPDEALGHANLGLVYLRMGRLDEAETRIARARDLDPNDPTVRLLMATVLGETDRRDAARRELEAGLAADSTHVKIHYELAEWWAASDTAGARTRERAYRERVVALAPANVAARMQLVEVVLRTGDVASAAPQLEAIRSQVADMPAEASAALEDALSAIRSGDGDGALTASTIARNVLRVTPIFQSGVLDLVGPEGPLAGFPVLTFSENVSFQVQEAGAVLAALRFSDATTQAGLDALPDGDHRLHVAVADYDADRDQDLYVGWSGGAVLARNDLGRFADATGDARLTPSPAAIHSRFADYDNDGMLDLYVVAEGANRLWRNRGDGGFADVTAASGIGDPSNGHASLFIDFDQDGDLDVIVANAGPTQAFRNNLDGTFLERTPAMGFPNDARWRDLGLGDFDDDGDVDVVAVDETAGITLWSNLRQARFENVTAERGLSTAGAMGAVAVGDYDNDGFLDLFVTSLDGSPYRLARNRRDGSFEVDRRSDAVLGTLQGIAGYDAAFLDFDNDGFLDLVVAGEATGSGAGGIRLLRNDGTGRFEDQSTLLPDGLAGARQVAVADYNEDGDADLFLAGVDGRVRLWRNDGGNANHYLNIQLTGLSAGNGKNNHYGIGAKIELRAADLYQMRVVTDPVTHFGLGQRLKADAVRILWTNGVPQNLFYPGSDQDVVEEQTLKGSCAFLYTWNGEEYTFVTDVMWRSAIGMPMGIMGGTTAFAPPHASQEYLRVPGDLLQPQNGVYRMQITEELWEAAYFDEVRLVAVDHPDTVDVYVDERFVPPGPPRLRIYQAADRRLPVAALDERGTNLLPRLAALDDRYVDNLVPARYQGVTAMHDLILDLGTLTADEAERVRLFLQGWIFPSDASINVAIAQSGDIEVVFPFLQVINERGEWETVEPNLSFPTGKNKTVVVELGGKFTTPDRRVRIRTNMEIYWDHAFFSTRAEEPNAIRRTTLTPVAADLHFRGFSRVFRKGGRFGPHWFDYGDVSTEWPWGEPMEGYYTRFGDVLPLLQDSDDMYVIMAAGDEVTVDFDAEALPPLPPGWTRDFLLYTDGWIKDADRNTATGDRIEPLPFHAMSQYPYRAPESYPAAEAARQDYLRTYNTRWMSNRLPTVQR